MTLIKTVLFAIQAYWSSFFYLPSAVLKEVQSLMTRFLWKGSLSHSPGARVAWTKLTQPLGEGGLGVKNLRDWNHSLLLLQLLKIVTWSGNSIWASWIRTYIIKSKPFWVFPIPSDCSWICRKVLRLRPLAIKFIRYKIGTGTNFSLWYDPWYQQQPFIHSFSSSLISITGFGTNAKLAMIISNGTWNLPPSNHAEAINLRQGFNYGTPIFHGEPDQILWGTCPVNGVKTKHIWMDIRTPAAAVPWETLVWCRLTPPRFAFLTWLAFHKALKTKDRLISYGFLLDPTCVLCGKANETFSHLFFECDFSFRVFIYVLRRCGWGGFSRTWGVITSGILALTPLKLKHAFLSLGLALVLYHIWKERNSRIFNRKSLDFRTLARQIVLILKLRLRSWARLQRCSHSLRHFVLSDF